MATNIQFSDNNGKITIVPSHLKIESMSSERNVFLYEYFIKFVCLFHMLLDIGGYIIINNGFNNLVLFVINKTFKTSFLFLCLFVTTSSARQTDYSQIYIYHWFIHFFYFYTLKYFLHWTVLFVTIEK